MIEDEIAIEVEALTDHVLGRATLDHTRTALLGASFGGFMTNWIADRTTRFDAIVTHADAVPDQTKKDLAPIIGKYIK